MNKTFTILRYSLGGLLISVPALGLWLRKLPPKGYSGDFMILLMGIGFCLIAITEIARRFETCENPGIRKKPLSAFRKILLSVLGVILTVMLLPFAELCYDTAKSVLLYRSREFSSTVWKMGNKGMRGGMLEDLVQRRSQILNLKSMSDVEKSLGKPDFAKYENPYVTYKYEIEKHVPGYFVPARLTLTIVFYERLVQKVTLTNHLENKTETLFAEAPSRVR